MKFDLVELFVDLALHYGSHEFKRAHVVRDLGLSEDDFAEIKQAGLIEPTHNGSHYSKVSDDGWRMATRAEKLGDKASMLG